LGFWPIFSSRKNRSIFDQKISGKSKKHDFFFFPTQSGFLFFGFFEKYKKIRKGVSSTFKNRSKKETGLCGKIDFFGFRANFPHNPAFFFFRKKKKVFFIDFRTFFRSKIVGFFEKKAGLSGKNGFFQYLSLRKTSFLHCLIMKNGLFSVSFP
jgi:hypothetical protein